MVEQKHERYVNPYTDFGFKKLFGTELNKDLLISLLNALFDRSAQQSPDEPRQVVKDLKYLPTEKLEAFGMRRAVFDVYCEGENGEKFIVEMQKASQDFFRDRSVFYSAQAEIARFSPDETRIYEESLKHYRDIRNVVNSAERRGRDEANRENARRMKAKGYAAEDIAEITGLAKEDINAL